VVFPNKGNFLTLWDPPDEYEQQYEANKPDHHPWQPGDEVIKPVGFDDFDLFDRNLSRDVNGVAFAFASKEACIVDFAEFDLNVDHIIVGDDRFYSFADERAM
jgi:hypothetical protein